MLVTGGTLNKNGGHSPGKSVELFFSNGTRLCSLPDLPGKRWLHSQTGLVTCGGAFISSYQKSCVTFSAGRWKKTHTLGQRRYGHSAWASPRGVMLIGGYHIANTTELLADNGNTTESFHLSNSRE